MTGGCCWGEHSLAWSVDTCESFRSNTCCSSKRMLRRKQPVEFMHVLGGSAGATASLCSCVMSVPRANSKWGLNASTHQDWTCTGGSGSTVDADVRRVSFVASLLSGKKRLRASCTVELHLPAPYVGQAYLQLLGGLCLVSLSPRWALTLALSSSQVALAGLPSLLHAIPLCLTVVVAS